MGGRGDRDRQKCQMSLSMSTGLGFSFHDFFYLLLFTSFPKLLCLFFFFLSLSLFDFVGLSRASFFGHSVTELRFFHSWVGNRIACSECMDAVLSLLLWRIAFVFSNQLGLRIEGWFDGR